VPPSHRDGRSQVKHKGAFRTRHSKACALLLRTCCCTECMDSRLPSVTDFHEVAPPLSLRCTRCPLPFCRHEHRKLTVRPTCLSLEHQHGRRVPWLASIPFACVSIVRVDPCGHEDSRELLSTLIEPQCDSGGRTLHLYTTCILYVFFRVFFPLQMSPVFCAGRSECMCCPAPSSRMRSVSHSES
jgi:hypothetical protein